MSQTERQWQTPNYEKQQMLEHRYRLRRANPIDWVCRSWVGDWQTDDRVTWRTTDGVWLAQLQRSPNGRRVFLYLWHKQNFVGYQDDSSWHAASKRARARQPRPVHRFLPLPLPLAG